MESDLTLQINFRHGGAKNGSQTSFKCEYQAYTDHNHMMFVNYKYLLVKLNSVGQYEVTFTCAQQVSFGTRDGLGTNTSFSSTKRLQIRVGQQIQ
jgi:hypothetical protein